MSRGRYDPDLLLSRAKEWRIEAAIAPLPELRDFCLSEAKRCETLVQRSFEILPIIDSIEKKAANE